jgi:hypothetical protein
VSDYDGAYTAHTACYEGAQGLERGFCRDDDIFFDFGGGGEVHFFCDFVFDCVCDGHYGG